MKIITSALLFSSMLLLFQTEVAARGAELHFDSACDFKELTMDIPTGKNANTSEITLHIILEPAASDRMAQVTRDHMNQSLTLYINGSEINTATVRAELNTGRFQVGIKTPLAKKVFPGLLAIQCQRGSKAPL